MRRGARLEGVAAQLLEPRLGLAVGREDPVVLGAGGRGDAVGEVVEGGLEVADVLGAGQHLLDHRAGRMVRQLLGQVADAQVLRAVDLARVGRADPDEDLDQRGLALAVAADERGPTARRQSDRHIVEEGARPVAERESGRSEHRPILRRGDLVPYRLAGLVPTLTGEPRAAESPSLHELNIPTSTEVSP